MIRTIEKLMPLSPQRRMLLILFMIVVVSLLHYTTPIHKFYLHTIIRRMYYIPLILSALWFGIRGGVLSWLTVSILYLPHILIQWRGHSIINNEQFTEVMLYGAISLLTGYMAEMEKRSRRKIEDTNSELKQAMEDLEQAYNELRKKSRELLEVENRLKLMDKFAVMGELSAGLSHQIKNPLASLRGAAEIFEERLKDREDLREMARIILKETDRLNNIVESFLHLAKSYDPKREITDVATVIKEYTEKKKESLGNDINLEVEVEKNSRVYLPAELIRQILDNLISNAIEASENRDLKLKIQVTERERDGLKRCVIIVMDSGPGIPEEHVKDIFTPFFTTKPGGAGLGLPICYRIIKRYDGNIEYRREGGWTVFEIQLPVVLGIDGG